MAVCLIYFVHGTTNDNQAGLSSGWNDVALSELGIEQSKKLAEQIKDTQFDAIFTSDLSRAIDSAKLMWSEDAPIIQDARLRECNYGNLNGYPSTEVEPVQETAIETPMPQGESYEMVKVRVKAFLHDLKTNYDGKHVAIVAHKAPQLALDVLLKNMTWEQAFAADWRKCGAWQAGWEYIVD